MKKNRTTILIYILLAITIVLAVFYFLRTRKLSGELKLSQEAAGQAISKTDAYRQLLSIDSMLLRGEYAGALSYYQSRLADGDLDTALQFRIELTRQLMKMRQKQTNFIDSSQLILEQDTIQPEQRYATPKEIRQYDSLSFALVKANQQLENLRQQLNKKAGGEYLTFKTTKGNKVHYVGEVKNDQANGRGVALLSTGSRYEGEWKNNLRHGEGTFYWPDGEYYKGEYRNDQRHGKGTYYWPNGEKFIGEWKEDERNGEGTFFGEEGEVIASGTWKDDELVEVDKN